MAMASQRNIVWQTQHRVCFSSPVNMATEDIVVFTHLSKSPAKSQISNWSLPSESKRVDALLFKLNYAHVFKNQGYKNSKLLITKSHRMTVRFACLDLKKKNVVTIRSPNIYVGRIKMLTLSRFQHFLKPCGTRDMKLQNFLSRNR